ncbi:PAS domain S-box protein [Xanthovirga aplysinae]|uniref:PAS domain S-box protein n=1 Tax=Xanthovirga aplysinae TaxID=2529853 RepID=UPI001656FDB8|nr:PAS domain S-box protein [Xanthovirga aplysinae]
MNFHIGRYTLGSLFQPILNCLSKVTTCSCSFISHKESAYGPFRVQGTNHLIWDTEKHIFCIEDSTGLLPVPELMEFVNSVLTKNMPLSKSFSLSFSRMRKKEYLFWGLPLIYHHEILGVLALGFSLPLPEKNKITAESLSELLSPALSAISMILYNIYYKQLTLEGPRGKFTQSLLALSKAPSLGEGDEEAFTELILSQAARLMMVERCSVWRYEKLTNQLICVKQFELSRHKFSSGKTRELDKYPGYAQALLHNRTITVSSTYTDSRTSELSKDYLNQHGITSILDAQILYQGNIIGAIFLEHVGTPRLWSADEEDYVATLSELYSLSHGVFVQKQTEVALQMAQKKYKGIFDANPLPLFVHDRKDFKFLTVNKAAEKIYGYSYEEFLNLSVFDLHPVEEHQKLKKIIRSYEAKKKELEVLELFVGEWTHLKKDRSSVAVEIYIHDLEYEGRTARLALVIDITEHKEHLKEREVIAERLQSLANLAAHNMRPPLARILGLTSIFDPQQLENQINRSIVKRLKEAANELDKMIRKMAKDLEKGVYKTR